MLESLVLERDLCEGRDFHNHPRNYIHLSVYIFCSTENEVLEIGFQVGDEGGTAKSAPMKMKVQFMLQVPQDDIHSSALMFRVKKRWDI